MAKLSTVLRNEKRRKLVVKFKAKRAALMAVINDASAADEDRAEARSKLERLPRDSSPVRVRNRCQLCGRPRGYIRRFKLCRICFRERALAGQIPGVTKSSW